MVNPCNPGYPCFTIAPYPSWSKTFFRKDLNGKNLQEGLKALLGWNTELIKTSFINNGRKITVVMHTIEIRVHANRNTKKFEKIANIVYHITKKEINKRTKEMTTELIEEKNISIE